MSQENEHVFIQGGESAMSSKEESELKRFIDIPRRVSTQHQGEAGGHEERMQASEIGSLIQADDEEGRGDPILRFVEEGDKVLFGVSEEEREKWTNLPPEIKEKALGFYALLRHYFDKGDEMDKEELKHLEEYFKRFLVLIRNSSSSDESEEKGVN